LRVDLEVAGLGFEVAADVEGTLADLRLDDDGLDVLVLGGREVPDAFFGIGGRLDSRLGGGIGY
jgi:hypothetical protein